MMLVRSTILMPSSAPGIVLSCAGRGRETAIALTWRHAVGDCDAKLGGNHAQRSRDFRRRHVSGVRADRDTTCCDDGDSSAVRQGCADENNKLATSDGSMRTTASGSTESTT